MRFFNHRWTKIVLVLSSCAAVSAGFMLSQSSAFRGGTGVKPSAEMQEWFESVATGDDDSVVIDLGNRSGGGGSEDDEKLCVYFFSVALNKYPKAKTLTATWQYVIAMGVDDFTIEYNRQDNTITEYYEGRGKSFKMTGRPIANVTDSMIHSAAEHYDSPRNIKKYS